MQRFLHREAFLLNDSLDILAASNCRPKKRKKEKRNGQMYKLNSVLPIDIFVKNLMAVHYPVCKINSINKK